MPLCHYYMQLQPTRTHRPGSLPVGAGGYPTAAHAESMPTAPPPNPGPVLRKINRGRWAAHCTAAAAAGGARTLTPTDAADSGLRLLPVTQLVAAPVWSSARLSETGHHPRWGVWPGSIGWDSESRCARLIRVGRMPPKGHSVRACLICAEPSRSLQWPFGPTTGPANASSIHGELIHGELIIIVLNNSSHFGLKLNYVAVQGAPLHRSRYSGLVVCVHSRD